MFLTTTQWLQLCLHFVFLIPALYSWTTGDKQRAKFRFNYVVFVSPTLGLCLSLRELWIRWFMAIFAMCLIAFFVVAEISLSRNVAVAAQQQNIHQQKSIQS